MDAKAVGRLIVRTRGLKGLNQTQLGELIGKDQATVSRLERGAFTAMPLPDDLAAIGRALGLSSLDLLRAAGYDVGGEGMAPDFRRVKERHLSELVAALDDDELDWLIVAAQLPGKRKRS